MKKASTKTTSASSSLDYSAIKTIVADNEIHMIDLKFCDLLGTWQHLTVPASQLSPELFTDGVFFDGSSIRGWRSIHESDMLLIPDINTARIDPFMDVPTLSFIGDVYDPNNKKPYERDPRHVVKRASAYLQSTGIADIAFFGPEAEFFIFDEVRFDQSINAGFYEVDSDDGCWNSGLSSSSNGGQKSLSFDFTAHRNLGYRPRPKEGYFPALPFDQHHDLRTEICLELENLGISVERHHHEVATGGQGEINFRFSSILEMADQMMWFKYVVKNVARRHGKTATFMPKPLWGDNGSGMHCHMSLAKKDGTPLFAGKEYAGLSRLALQFVAGILKHAPATCALTNPTTNSYRRLIPGFEAPVKLAYSFHNRSAAIRIPNTGENPKAKRIEFRTPDASSNIYFCLAALLMAGIDGIQTKADPGSPVDQDIYSMSADQLAKIPSVPGSLEESLNCLKKDHQFLTQGNVFSADLIQTWIDYKLEREVRASQQRPTPFEFQMYFDV